MRSDEFLGIISIECLQGFIAIVQTGSFNRAAERLAISQPGISSRIRKVEKAVGGTVLIRFNAGWGPTERGKKLMVFAERFVSLHNQIAWMGGASPNLSQAVRMGICDTHAPRFLRLFAQPARSDLQIQCGSSADIERMYDDGYFDIACFLSSAPSKIRALKTWKEDQVWACAPGFSVASTSPVPLVLDPVADEHCLDECHMAGLANQVVFQAKDLSLRIKAVAASIGVMPLPRANLPLHLMIAENSRLPPLQPLSAYLCCRDDLDTDVKSLAKVLAGTGDAAAA